MLFFQQARIWACSLALSDMLPSNDICAWQPCHDATNSVDCCSRRTSARNSRAEALSARAQPIQPQAAGPPPNRAQPTVPQAAGPSPARAQPPVPQAADLLPARTHAIQPQAAGPSIARAQPIAPQAAAPSPARAQPAVPQAARLSSGIAQPTVPQAAGPSSALIALPAPVPNHEASRSDAGRACSICLSSESCIAFIRCGHECMCMTCAVRVSCCPLCRAQGKQIRLFHS